MSSDRPLGTIVIEDAVNDEYVQLGAFLTFDEAKTTAADLCWIMRDPSLNVYVCIIIQGKPLPIQVVSYSFNKMAEITWTNAAVGSLDSFNGKTEAEALQPVPMDE